jgi:beta-xylosidase
MTSKNGDWLETANYPWTPDQGDGNFRNPILCADYSDPDVIRHGDDFYLVASSFNCTPALPILHSQDLVNWSIIGHAMKNLPAARFSQVQAGCGVWAPAIRSHAERFYIFFSMPDEGIFMIWAEHPAGEWSAPHLVQQGKGLIDPCPLWDEDGRAYLAHAYAFSRAGIKHQLRICPMAPDGSRLLGEGKIIFEDPQRHPTVEGPKFYKRNGYYYVLAPAGGVADGWQLALRSRQIFGPYQHKIVLERGNTPINGPHQGALVDAPDGSNWFLHFQERLPYGRIVHLQPVRWENDWPIMGVDHDGNGVGEPVNHFRKPVVRPLQTPVPPQTSDEFDQPKLGLQWQWQANHTANWSSLTDRPGWLRLFTQPAAENDLAKMPSVIAQKFPALAFTVQTRIDTANLKQDHQAGLIILGRANASLVISVHNGCRSISLNIGGEQAFVAQVQSEIIDLRAEIELGGKCVFGYADGLSQFQTLPQTFQAREGHWIGAKVGLLSISSGEAAYGGYADFDYFRFAPPLLSRGQPIHPKLKTIRAWRKNRRKIARSTTQAKEAP